MTIPEMIISGLFIICIAMAGFLAKIFKGELIKHQTKEMCDERISGIKDDITDIKIDVRKILLRGSK